MTPQTPQAQFSKELPHWLHVQNKSLVLSTYRANRLLFIGTDHQAKLKLQERFYDRPMGLFSNANSLWMAGRCHLWRLDNFLSPGQTHEGGDHLFVPSASFLTGEVNAHEVIVGNDGEPLFVNTLFSCLAGIGAGTSFKPKWQPPFIDELAAEDRCHLNGVALKAGEATWATACSMNNAPTGWRQQRNGGGVLIHIPSGEIQAGNLSMPHSPRWHRGRLWLLNSGTGELGSIENGLFEPLCALPGFIRGLGFVDGCAVVGLSKLRSPHFTGLPLEQRLNAENRPEGFCGIRVVDLNSGKVLHSLDLPDPIDELFDLEIIEGVRQPRALGLLDKSIEHLLKLPGSEQLIQIRPGKPDNKSKPTQPAQQTEHMLSQLNTANEVRFQRIFQLTPATLKTYAALTYPPLQPGSTASKTLHGEILGISAMAHGTMVGLIIAERLNNQRANVVSFMVEQSWRRIGIGTHLMSLLTDLLAEEKTNAVSIRYQAPIRQSAPVDRILSRLGWPSPQEDYLLLTGQSKQLARLSWPESYPLPDGYHLMSWTPSYLDALKKLEAPTELQAVVHSPLIEPELSLILFANRTPVGYLIVERTSRTATRYGALFVSPGHRARGQALHLLAAGFRRQAKAEIPIARAAVAPHSKAMLRLTRRRLKQHLLKITLAKRCQLDLQDQGRE